MHFRRSSAGKAIFWHVKQDSGMRRNYLNIFIGYVKMRYWQQWRSIKEDG